MIVLINPFEVPPEVSDEAFLVGWQRAADYLQGQPGFIRSALHRAGSPEHRFRFINVAEWQSPEAFRAAVGGEEFQAMARRSASVGYPGLYEVVRTVTTQEAALSEKATASARTGEGGGS